MAEKDVNDYLNQQIAGNPQLNAAEKQLFLGILEERIRVYMLLKDMTHNNYFKKIEQIIKDSPGGKIRMSAALDSRPRMAFIKIAQKHNVPFTIVDNNYTNQPLDDTHVGMIYHFDHLITLSAREISKII